VCADGAIQNYTNRLVNINSQLDNTQRSQALAFLVHFIGDLHQPLHAGFASDMGGTQLMGHFLNNPNLTSLHMVWDTSIITQRINSGFNGSSVAYLNYLLTIQVNSSLLSCPYDQPYLACSHLMATESAAYACEAAYVYPNGTSLKTNNSNDLWVIDIDYYERAFPLVDLRLAQAGYRLGAVLNAVSQPSSNNSSTSSGGGDSDSSLSAFEIAIGLIIGVLSLGSVCLCFLYIRKRRQGLDSMFELKDEKLSGGLILGVTRPIETYESVTDVTDGATD